jgi:DNA-binding CsgD family transcriptional regulator
MEAVKPHARRRLRVAIRVEDAGLAADLRVLFVAAGHEVVEGEPADIVMSDAPAGFAAVVEADALLTPRELDVLGAIGEGLTNKALARKLGISLHTVKFHIESVFRKLGARTRTEALAKAAERRVDI